MAAHSGLGNPGPAGRDGGPRRGGAELSTPAPESGRDDGDSEENTEKAPGFKTVAGHMWRVRSIRHLCLGSALAGFIGYGFVLWMPSFLVRSHGLSPTEVGLILALMSGVVGSMGTRSRWRIRSWTD